MNSNIKNKIIEILASLDGANEEEEYEAVYQLYDYVKLYEGEPMLKPMEEALPDLCKYLLDDRANDLQGCMFSIFRRVKVSEETIQKIITLYKISPCESLIIPLGNIDADQFSEEIQTFVLNAVDEYPSAMVSVFSNNWTTVLSPKTIDTLYKIFLRIEELDIPKRVSVYTYLNFLSIFCYQTSNDNYQQSIEILESIFPTLKKNSKLHIIKLLSFSGNKGFSIFKIALLEEDQEIKFEIINSLKRVGGRPAMKMIKLLTADKNPKVVKAALKAVESLKAKK